MTLTHRQLPWVERRVGGGISRFMRPRSTDKRGEASGDVEGWHFRGTFGAECGLIVE